MTRFDDARARVCTRAVAAVAGELGIRDIPGAAALLDWDDVLDRALARRRIDPDTVRAALIDALDELASREPSILSSGAQARRVRGTRPGSRRRSAAPR